MSDKIFINYKCAGETIRRFHASRAFVKGIRGPFGSGKSSACCHELFLQSIRQRVFRNKRRSKHAVIRNSYPNLRDTTIPTFLKWIPETTAEDYEFTLSRQPPMIGHLEMVLKDKTKVESEFIFLALDQEDDQKKLKSLDLSSAWVNEACEIKKENWDVLFGRVDRFPPKDEGGVEEPGIIMDTNPPDTENWWYKMAEEQKPDGMEFFAQPPAILPVAQDENEDKAKKLYVPNRGQDPRYGPCENWENHNAGFNYWLRQVAGKSEEWIKVYLMGQYGVVSYGQPVFHEYNDDVHCSKKPLEPYRGLPFIVGVDFGSTPCALIGQLSPFGQLRIYDELVTDETNRMGIRQFVQGFLKPLIVNKYNGANMRFVVDAAGNQRSQVDEVTCIQEMAYHGINAEPCPSNVFGIRREAVAHFLIKLSSNGESGFLIDPRCTVLRKSFNGLYRYRRLQVSGEVRHAPEPEKTHPWSDVMDALEYMAEVADMGNVNSSVGGNFQSASRHEVVRTGVVKGFT